MLEMSYVNVAFAQLIALLTVLFSNFSPTDGVWTKQALHETETAFNYSPCIQNYFSDSFLDRELPPTRVPMIVVK